MAEVDTGVEAPLDDVLAVKNQVGLIPFGRIAADEDQIPTRGRASDGEVMDIAQSGDLERPHQKRLATKFDLDGFGNATGRIAAFWVGRSAIQHGRFPGMNRHFQMGLV